MATNRVSINSLMKGMDRAIKMDVRDKKHYENGKPTDEFESTVVEIGVKGVGNCQIVLPYRKGLAEEIDQQLEYGDLFAPSDVFEIVDTQVSIYNNALSIKYLAKER